MKTTHKLLLTILLACGLLAGCKFWHNTMKPVVRKIDEVAQHMCGFHFGEVHGITVKEATQKYCDAREKYAPWIDPALAGVQQGASAGSGEPFDVCGACTCEDGGNAAQGE